MQSHAARAAPGFGRERPAVLPVCWAVPLASDATAMPQECRWLGVHERVRSARVRSAAAAALLDSTPACFN
eukprot:173679-Lingulodinium_polyedra.AAC.1